MYSEQELAQFNKMGVTPPTHTPHLTDEQIAEHSKKLLPRQWKLEGNQLKGQTDMGELVLHISTDYILKGTDEDGMPILEKVDIQT